MKAIFFIAIIAVAFAAIEGEIVCNLCTSLVGTLENILTTSGAEKVRDYINTLCAKASGFIATICNSILNFGVDELIKLIQNRANPTEVCTKIHAC